ncbi:adenylate/guanylate cyclase domain-containing protein [Spongiimicrobium salis]|uniref:adenylate/guanylate cyclase domain-containing protein n=1 Tax=Spongiimicrobium salis TaxID=1667022 RepID=UPI00374DD403
MKYTSKYRRGIILDYVIGWTLAFVFLSIVRGLGTEELGKLNFDFQSSLLIAITLGPLMGLISGYVQMIMEERFYRRVSIQRFLLIRLVYIFIFLVILVLLAYGIYNLYFQTSIDLVTFAVDAGSGAIYFYVITVDFFLSVLRQVNLMLGTGTLGKLLLGRYYEPKVEERIFMFLDLQSATSLAEKLGHITYSKLLQDCFNDLGVVVGDEAEIYQYVGDEAVLTWNYKNGIRQQNCINAFFRFTQQLRDNKAHYLAKYGCEPFFKAGIHLGRITVTEVGALKKEIAFHGDTINTASRIQSQCNALGETLLISEALKTKLSGESYTYTSLGAIPLKGKKKAVPVYAVKPA